MFLPFHLARGHEGKLDFSAGIISHFWAPRYPFSIMLTATLLSQYSFCCCPSYLLSFLLNYGWGEVKAWVDKSGWAHGVSMVPCLEMPGSQAVLGGQTGDPSLVVKESETIMWNHQSGCLPCAQKRAWKELIGFHWRLWDRGAMS